MKTESKMWCSQLLVVRTLKRRQEAGYSELTRQCWWVALTRQRHGSSTAKTSSGLDRCATARQVRRQRVALQSLSDVMSQVKWIIQQKLMGKSMFYTRELLYRRQIHVRNRGQMSTSSDKIRSVLHDLNWHAMEIQPNLGSREFPTPPQGVNTPNFRTTPPASGGKERERGEGGGWKGRGEKKRREGTPKGWLTPPCSKSWKIPCSVATNILSQPSCGISKLFECERWTWRITVEFGLYRATRMHSADYAWQDVCLSVCPSVTRRYWV